MIEVAALLEGRMTANGLHTTLGASFGIIEKTTTITTPIYAQAKEEQNLFDTSTLLTDGSPLLRPCQCCGDNG